tara:strand:- start:61 stop:576 length:516 start_codon:yes stop_codon:yes gene_type:complete
MGACLSLPASSSSPSSSALDGYAEKQKEKKKKKKKKNDKKKKRETGKEEEEDEFDRAMMSSEYARLQTIKKERAKQRTRSECEKLDEIADALATIEKEKKELSNARRHLRNMNRAAKARGSDGLGDGIVGVAGSSESSRREGEGAVSSSAEATTTMTIAKKSNLSVNETTS